MKWFGGNPNFKNPDGHPGNLCKAPSGAGWQSWKRGEELRRKDAEIQEREYHLKELREQLSDCGHRAPEELQNKCIQLNKLPGCGAPAGGSLPESPDKVPLEVQRKTSGLVSLHKQEGAKAGVSASQPPPNLWPQQTPEFPLKARSQGLQVRCSPAFGSGCVHVLNVRYI